MSEARNVLRNSTVLTAGNLADRLLSMVAGVILARALGPAALGTYTFAFTYVGFLTVFVDLGIRTIIDRDIARDPACTNELVGNGMAMRLAAAVVTIAVANLGIRCTGYPPETLALVAVASLSLLLVFSSLYLTVFEVSLRMERPMVVTLVTSGIRTTLFLAVAALGPSPIRFAWAVLAGSLFSVGCLAWISRGLLQPHLTINRTVWGYLVGQSWPLIVSSLVSMVYYRVDQLMLYPMAGEQATGYYATAVKLVESVRVLPSAFMASVFPLMSRWFQESPQRFERSYCRSVRYVTIMAFGALILFTGAGAALTCLLFGNVYLPSVPALQVLAWAEVFMFCNMVNNSAILAMNLQRIVWISSGVSAGVNVILNLILIPRCGMLGAAWATVVSYAMLLVTIFLFTATRGLLSLWAKNFIPAAAGGTCGVVAGWALARSAGWPWALAGAYGVFILGLWVFRAVTAEDREVLKGAFARRRP